MRRLLILILTFVLLLPAAAGAEWLTLTEANAREDGDFLVRENSGTLTLTFLGDCTLGGERKVASSARGYVKTVKKNGAGWPLGGVLPWTGTDDLTLVNLEGVLTDRDLPPEEKTFNFRGPTSLTAVLTEGGVECVTLANNHAHDYGEAGYADTRAALEKAGVAATRAEEPVLWTNGDLTVGFTASGANLSRGEADRLREQISALREVGCDLVIHSMHGGVEYQSAPTARQRETARIAAEAGADLVIGHHPHIVQGWELIGSTPVFYSLGNASFGGNADPRDYDALMVQAVFTLEEGIPLSLELRLVPLSVSSAARVNDYRPTPLTGENAARVLRKMEESTGVEARLEMAFEW